MKLKTLALGAAAGYGVARVIEAKANGVPLLEAFRPANLLKPVSAIRALLPATASNAIQVIDVTPAT